MKGLKQQLERVKSYDDELSSMIEESPIDSGISDESLDEFREWRKETDKPYDFVNNKFDRESYELARAVSNIGGNFSAMIDELSKGNYERAEREIEAAYRLAGREVEVKA